MARITRHGGVSDARLNEDQIDARTAAAAPIPDRFRNVQVEQGHPLPDGDVEQVEQVDGDNGDEATDGEPELPPLPDVGPDPESDDEGAVDGHPVADPVDEPASAQLDLPPANALKSVWAETLAGAGVAREWIDGEGRTKEDLVATGRGIADGSLVVVDGEPVPAGE